MNGITQRWISALLCIGLIGSGERLLAAEAGPLRAAAFKVDITPDDPTGLLSVYQTAFTGVHDHTYARGIVLSNGISSAVIVSFDAVEISDVAMVAQLARRTGIPAANIILTGTHDHTAPMIGLQNATGDSKGGPGAAAFTAKVEHDVGAALEQAKARMVPARMGIGSGRADINISRDLPAADGKYRLGANPQGPSDKTVRVLKFESLGGEPIAILISYAVHGTTLNPKASLVTGEIAGATSHAVEDHFDGKAVAIWTMSAAGDQAPVLMQSDREHPNAEENFAVSAVLGRILGAETIRVADKITATDANIKLWAAEQWVTCPGQKAVPGPVAGERVLIDAPPVSFRLGVLMIDQIAITSVSAEVVTNIYQRVREQSPFANTLMITIANGRIGYVPQDASYANPTFEVYSSPLKPGCGEPAIVNGLVELMKAY